MYVGIDIGGTSIKAGVVDGEGSVLQFTEVPTPLDGLDPLLSALARISNQFQDAFPGIRALGAGVPGLRSRHTGRIEVSPNLTALRGVDVETAMRNATGLAVITSNDANATAVGEWRFGSAMGCSQAVCLTLGTGVGCGLILEGRPFQGASGYAGEAGHIPLNPDGEICSCGSRGCLETQASATAVIRRFLRLRGPAGPGNNEGQVTAHMIADAARSGDPVAQQVFAEAGMWLGLGCATLINLLNPEVIVIAGGLAGAADLLLPPAIEAARRGAFVYSFEDCRIVRSSLGRNAGVIGAAIMARDAFA